MCRISLMQSVLAQRPDREPTDLRALFYDQPVDDDLAEFEEEILLSLEPECKQAGHTIILTGSEDIFLVSYPGVIMQVITNLVANALTHAFCDIEKGHIAIDISREEEVLLLRCSDDGRGMSEEEKACLYDPFFTTGRSRGGTGLGMHIVYNLVSQKLGGTIHCESTPGEGTSLFIRIPAGATASGDEIAVSSLPPHDT